MTRNARSTSAAEAIAIALHDGAADEADGTGRRDRGQVGENVNQQPGGAVSARQGEPAVLGIGSVGDSYDNALAETIKSVFKPEVIHRRGPWRNAEAVEFAALEWMEWFNHRRLLAPLGNIPLAEAHAYDNEQPQALPMVA